MRLVSKRVVIAHEPGRAPVCSFVTYIHPTKPVLLRNTGWSVGNDINDDFVEALSLDNGRTWQQPEPSCKSRRVEGGFEIRMPGAALLLPQREQLLSLSNQKFEPSLEHQHREFPFSLHITTRDLDLRQIGDAVISNFGRAAGVGISFCNPIVDFRGRIVVPLFLHGPVESERTTGVLLGEIGPDNSISWRRGGEVPFEPGISSRGLVEGAIMELSGGRLLLILRSSNAACPDRPNYKWYSLSDDGGETWSRARPLEDRDGNPVQSSATGSAMFRSLKNGKLYWMGNACLRGEHPQGNMPRSPLYLIEMSEQPLALLVNTATVIDERQPGEEPTVQMSNFVFYQDRETHEIVVFLTRYGERGYANGSWLQSDLYEYRIALD